jgi:hypothetical protein
LNLWIKDRNKIYDDLVYIKAFLRAQFKNFGTNTECFGAKFQLTCNNIQLAIFNIVQYQCIAESWLEVESVS